MAVTKQQKNEILADLKAKFSEAKSIGFATTNTLTVEEFSELRANLRTVNATYTLAKKTLMKIALKEALNLEVDLKDMPGQIGVVCSNEDAVSGLGKVNEFLKEANGKKGDLGKVAWAISVFEGEVKTNSETKIIAGMPSRETLLGRLVGSMMSPVSKLARFFDSAAKDLESQGKASVSELKAEKTVAAAKVEEVKEEIKVEETPVVETPTEEVVVATEEAKAE